MAAVKNLMVRCGADFSGLNRAMTSTEKGMGRMQLSAVSLKNTMSRLFSFVSVAALIQFGKEAISAASDLQEVQNVVDVTFGEMSKDVDAFAKTAIRQFGLSETAAKQYTGTMGAMLKSMGLTKDAAAQMSMTITGLVGDIASFYNISADEAMTKVRAGISGETEPLKQLGINMSIANLKAYALSQGVTKAYTAMTQGEQAILRYNYLLSVTSDAQGDFARTSGGWANQTRLLSMQMQQLGANVGTLLMTVFLPAVKVINEIVADLVAASGVLANAVAGIFGVQISQNVAVAKSAEEAAAGQNALAQGIGAAAKAAKKSTAGFDELTKLQDAASAGGGGSSSTGSDFNMDLESQSTVVDASIVDPKKFKNVANIIKRICGYIPTIAAGLGGLKLGSFIADLLSANVKVKTLSDALGLLKNKAGITITLSLSLLGAGINLKGVVDTIREGLNGINFAEILGGGLLEAGSLAAFGAQVATFVDANLAGGAIDLAITQAGINLGVGTAAAAGAALMAGVAGILVGIPTMIAAIYDAIVNGIDWLSGILIPVGGAAVGAGAAVILTALGTAISPGIGTLIGLAVGLVTDLIILIVQNWESISAWFSKTFSEIGKWCSDLWSTISTTASNCWNSLVEYFSPATEWFSQLFGSIKQTIDDVFYDIGVIAGGCWQVVSKAWGVATGWFDEKIVQPVSKFFGDMWVGLSEGAKKAWAAAKQVFSTVGEFFRDTFSKAWQKVVAVFSPLGDVFIKIKDAVLSGFKVVVNGLISGINSVVSIPFNGLNWALDKLRSVNIMGLTPFVDLRMISIPQIPKLAKGAVIPPNNEFIAMLGDQSSGVNIEAPLTTIEEAVANVMGDFEQSNIAGHEMTASLLGKILEAVLRISLDDDVIGAANLRFEEKRGAMAGGYL